MPQANHFIRLSGEKCKNLQVIKASIVRVSDDNPDTSWIGEYSKTPANEFAIETGGQGGRYPRYFNAASIDKSISDD